MKEIIFLIEDDLDGGFNAQALGYSIYTEGDTVDELKENIREALRCHFNSEDAVPRIVRLHFVHEEIRQSHASIE